MREEYQEYKRGLAPSARFRRAGAADVIRMFESHTNEKGESLSQFEFEAICERWCEVFGFLPPLGPPDETPKTEPDPLPADDAMISIRDVLRITGLSKSTIKRWVNDPASTFPKPVKLSERAIRWPANQVKAWRKRHEERASGRKH